MLKAFWINGLVFLSSLCLVLGGFEFALRAGLFENQYHKGAVLQGELKNPKFKIMILGDSFLANWGNGNSLSEQLVRDLQAKGVQVLNTAAFGDGPADYLIQMKAYGPAFHPGQVLLFYYAGNDLSDVQYRSGLKTKLKKIFKPWFLHSRLFCFLKSKIEVFRRKGVDYAGAAKKGVDPEAIRLTETGKINPWLVALSQKKPEYLLDNLLMRTKENLKAWEQAQDPLKEIRRISIGLGAHFFLVMIPSTAQINRSHFDFYRSLGFNVDARTLQEDRPQQLMKEFCENEKIDCLDLLPLFRAQKEKEFYKTRDDHFNREGNELSKTATLDFLRTRFRGLGF